MFLCLLGLFRALYKASTSNWSPRHSSRPSLGKLDVTALSPQSGALGSLPIARNARVGRLHQTQAARPKQLCHGRSII